jgi:hypothetical protein
MKAFRATWLLLGLTCALTRTIACASGNTEADLSDAATPMPSGPTPEPDAAPMPVHDASVDAADAAADAALDAGRKCSPDGFCQTSLPGPTPSADGGVPDGVQRDVDLRDVWVAPDGRAFAVSAAGDLIGWSDGAWSVLLETGLPLRFVWAESADELWLAAESGSVVHVTRDAAGYHAIPEATGSTDVVDGFEGKGDHLWIVTHAGTLLLRDATTGTWHDDPYPFDAQGDGRLAMVEAMWRNGGDVWARGLQFGDCPTCATSYQHLLLHWEPDADAGDAGATDWRTVPLAGENLFAGSVSAGIGDAFLLCASYACDQIARAVPVDGGYASTLEPTNVPFSQAFGLWSGAQADAWLVGSRGVVRHYDGAAWSLARIAYEPVPILADLHAVRGRVDESGNSEVWIVGDNIAMRKAFTP